MTTIKLILLICFIGVTFNCKAQQIQELNLETNIIGTWIMNDDPLVKIIFTSRGKYLLYNDNVLMDTYTYSYSFGKSCNSETLTSDDDIFLRIVNTSVEFGDTICYFINTININLSGVTTLSLTSERGQLVVFTKQ